MEKLTNLPTPARGSKESVAYALIDEILNYSLNRHIHLLEKSGFLNGPKYYAEYGWIEGKRGKALALKHELMDEVQTKFTNLLIAHLREQEVPSDLNQKDPLADTKSQKNL